jgi:hypothetical protein
MAGAKNQQPATNNQLQLQLKLPDRELDRLKAHIYRDFMGARDNHDRRIEKFRRIYRMWRGLGGGGTREDGAEFQLPMIKWFTFGHWSRCMQALLGDDAQIVAVPTAPTDEKDARMAGDFETWRFFEYMQATSPLTVWMFRTVLFGVGHAELLYEQRYFWERDPKTGLDTEKLCYDGPALYPLWPSQIVLPAQDDVQSQDDFEWRIRRRRVTPQQLLDGERRGKYQGVRENWATIMDFAKARQERDYWWDDERLDADAAEGVDHATVMGTRDSIEVWEWYGKWRLLKGKQDGREENIERREVNQSELLVKYLPHAELIVGAQDLRDLYPGMKKRNPFVDCHLVRDGSYWGPGLGELLEDLQREGTINHNLFRSAGMFSVGPVIFYRPGSGFDPETFEVKPKMAIPTEDPNAVNVVKFDSNLQYPMEMGQLLKGLGELVTGIPDTLNNQTTAGSTVASRTASGQAMLLQEGNVRASLDMTMLREDMSQMLGYCWSLDRELGDEEVWFRVTGDDTHGLYDTNKGFGRMTSEQRNHEFGFELKFATSVWSREAKKAAVMALYQLSVQNPIVAQNPSALWAILNKVWDAFGEKNFGDILPEPPVQDTPRQPKQEEEMLAAGDADEVHVNPLDDDLKHLDSHRKQLLEATQEPKARQDKRFQAELVKHILDHEKQRRQKMLLQAAFQAAMQAHQQQQQNGAPPNGLGPAFPQSPGFTGPNPQPFPGQGGGAPGGDVAAAGNIAGPGGVGAPQ